MGLARALIELVLDGSSPAAALWEGRRPKIEWHAGEGNNPGTLSYVEFTTGQDYELTQARPGGSFEITRTRGEKGYIGTAPTAKAAMALVQDQEDYEGGGQQEGELPKGLFTIPTRKPRKGNTLITPPTKLDNIKIERWLGQAGLNYASYGGGTYVPLKPFKEPLSGVLAKVHREIPGTRVQITDPFGDAGTFPDYSPSESLQEGEAGPFKTGLLAGIEKVGQSVAYNADPSTWSYEKMDRAKYFQKLLPAIRTCYKEVRAAVIVGQAEAALDRVLRVVTTGIERNQLLRVKDRLEHMQLNSPLD